MGTVLLNLVPLIIGSAILPMWFIVTLLLLHSERGVAKATAFSAGAITVRLLQGLVFGFVARETSSETSSKGLLAALVLMVLGILLWVAAIVKWCREETQGGPPSKWVGKLTRISVLRAYGVGAVLMVIAVKPLVFTLAAIALIDEANLIPVKRVATFIIFVIGAHLLVMSPVIISVAMPVRGAKLLDAAQRWLQRNNRIITVVLSAIFGTFFFYKGASALLHPRPSAPQSLVAPQPSGEAHATS